MTAVEVAKVSAGVRQFKTYPAYKNSGIEWLGEIPTHWKVERSDAILRYENLQVDPSELLDDVVFHYSIPSVQGTGDGVLEPPSEIESAKLRIAGERLLVSKLNPRKGVVLIATQKDVPTVCSTEFVPFEVRGCECRWALYLFLAVSTRQRLSAVVRSATRSHQRAEIADIVKMWHGVPTITEQRTIAAFLDQETARIDALVKKKERVIDLLQEKRIALITRAVTKGLDPNVPMRDSGIEWLREIPSHWETKRIRDIAAALQTGPFGSQLHAEEYVLGGHPVINPANLRDGKLVEDVECTVDDATAARLAHHRLREGDILFARRGELGRCGLVTGRQEGWLCGTGCLRLRVRVAMVSPFFLMHLLSTSGVADWLELQSVGATMQNLNTAIIGRIPIVVPPTTEQEAITIFVERETARIDSLLAKVRDAIEQLRELRTALISAAITGKIDVREEVA